MDSEFEVFFPEIARNKSDLDQSQHIKERTKAILEGILTGNLTEQEKQVAKIDAYLLSAHNPNRYDGHSGLEVRMKKGFDETCLAIETQGIETPHLLTVRKFYSAIEMCKKTSK